MIPTKKENEKEKKGKKQEKKKKEMNTSAGSSKNVPTSATPNVYDFHDYKVPSSEIRGRSIGASGSEEQSEISHIQYKHLWLRERHQVPYDLKWHLIYTSATGLFFGSIATVMTSRVRNNNLAKFANAYKVGAMLFGVGLGHLMHDDLQRTRWFYDDDDDV